MDINNAAAKTIIFMRHARAPMRAGMDDRERILDSLGETQALLIGKQLSEAAPLPDRILCSPAQRTRQTFNLVGQSWPQLTGVQTEYPQSLYDAATGDIFAILQELPEEVSRLMVIGHNPGMPGIVNMLWDDTENMIDDMMIMTYPPASCTILEQRDEAGHAQSWRDIQPKSFRVQHFLTP